MKVIGRRMRSGRRRIQILPSTVGLDPAGARILFG